MSYELFYTGKGYIITERKTVSDYVYGPRVIANNKDMITYLLDVEV